MMNEHIISSTYLTDESGVMGTATELFLPKTPEELQSAVCCAAERRLTLCVQGAKTGFLSGAVPQGGAVINLSRMNAITGFRYNPTKREGRVTVQAGCTVQQISEFLRFKRCGIDGWDEQSWAQWEMYRQAEHFLWFAPNPTESTATIGGVIATAAAGSRAYCIGELNEHVKSVTLLLADGKLFSFSRGDDFTSKLTRAGVEAPQFPGGDVIDCVCGSEGTIGIVAEATLCLYEMPDLICGLLSFHNSPENLDGFLRSLKDSIKVESGVKLLSASWFDVSCARLMHQMDSAEQGAMRPDFPEDASAALWLELNGCEDDVFGVFEVAMELMEAGHGIADAALVATNANDLERLGSLRHMVTEAANTKCSGSPMPVIDWQSPTESWAGIAQEVLSLLEESGLSYVLMGCAGSGKANLRFVCPEEYRVESEQVAKRIVDLLIGKGCSSSGEHGYGRLKQALLRSMCPEKHDGWLRLRRSVDRERMLNPGVMTD